MLCWRKTTGGDWSCPAPYSNAWVQGNRVLVRYHGTTSGRVEESPLLSTAIGREDANLPAVGSATTRSLWAALVTRQTDQQRAGWPERLDK